MQPHTNKLVSIQAPSYFRQKHIFNCGMHVLQLKLHNSVSSFNFQSWILLVLHPMVQLLGSRSQQMARQEQLTGVQRQSRWYTYSALLVSFSDNTLQCTRDLDEIPGKKFLVSRNIFLEN